MSARESLLHLGSLVGYGINRERLPRHLPARTVDIVEIIFIEGIKKESPILKELIDTRKGILVGGGYDLETGVVKFIN